MQLNNYFNLKRFARLLKQDLLINKTKYLLTTIGFLIVSYLVFYWYLGTKKHLIVSYYEQIKDLYSACFVFYLMAVAVVVGTAFPDLSDKIKTSNYLLNPGSTLEKFLVQFLIRVGFFVPIALMIFWLAIRLVKASLTPELLYDNTFFDPNLVPYFEFRDLFIDYSNNNKILPIWLILGLIFGVFSYGVYLFAGATYFKRYALVKTVILSGAILFGSISFSVVLSHIFYPKETIGFDTQLKYFTVREHLDSGNFFALILALSSWVFFMAIAYFNLKEKEI